MLLVGSNECSGLIPTGTGLLHIQQICSDFEKNAHFVDDECCEGVKSLIDLPLTAQVIMRRFKGAETQRHKVEGSIGIPIDLSFLLYDIAEAGSIVRTWFL